MPHPSGTEWGEALIKMNTVTNAFTSYFGPSNQATLDNQDLDLGGAGPVILPSVSPLVAPMIVAGGKSGEIYLLNTANLKGYRSSRSGDTGIPVTDQPRAGKFQSSLRR